MFWKSTSMKFNSIFDLKPRGSYTCKTTRAGFITMIHVFHIYIIYLSRSVGNIRTFSAIFQAPKFFTLNGDIRDAPSVSLFQSRLKHFLFSSEYSLDNEHRSLFTSDLIIPCLILLLDEYVSVCLCLLFVVCDFLVIKTIFVIN
jgi:hypothetical protein